MRGRIVAIALGLAVVAALGAACDDEPAPPPFPSSAFPSPTGASTGSTGDDPGLTGGSGPTGIATGPTEALPSPGTGDGTLSRGRFSIRITGDLQTQATLTNLLSGVVTPPPGGFAVVWTAGGMDATTVGLGGGTVLGTQPTSPTLILSLVAQSDGGIHSWTSSAGECEVTISSATSTRLAGSLDCRDLGSTDGVVVDVSGTFQATG